MSIPLICISLLAFLCIALGFSVSMARAKSNVLIGCSDDPENSLYQLIRAHGNTIEYAPILALLIFILSLSPQSDWVIWFMVLATAARYLFAAGIVFPKTLAKPNPMRFVGALSTYFFGAGLSVALLIQAVGL